MQLNGCCRHQHVALKLVACHVAGPNTTVILVLSDDNQAEQQDTWECAAGAPWAPSRCCDIADHEPC